MVACVLSYVFSRVATVTRVVAWTDTVFSKPPSIYSSHSRRIFTLLTNDFRKHISTSLFAILYSMEQASGRVSRCRLRDSTSAFIFSGVRVQ